ncbi:U3 small nucleolar RNA-associated protein 25-like [Coffea eugenioides]|uniref:U3 small nucleolar RNA-associated protein 25-like n=1 Tax=Coffea eugenioides TaxID=49369 RepID=UPI000F60CBF2|nr:U3 small nucleolar RNA-associated protein 25-like [Coffea eugenioides]
MGKPGFARKRGLKRVNSSKPFKKFKNLKLNPGAEKLVPKQPLENDSEDWSDENSEAELETKEEEEVEEDIVFNRKPTMYDNLLKRLGSSSQLIANAIKQRKRGEEGKSDTEDDESESEVEDDNEGSIDECPRRIEMINGAKESGVPGSTEKSEDSGSDDGEIGASDSDEEHDSRTNVESITSRSTFSSHLDYKLSQGEVDNLFKRKWNYKWEVPALRAPNCKWRGTGDCFLKDIDMNEMCGLKPRLYKHWVDVYQGSGGTDFQSSEQRFFFSICNSYRDVLHHNKKPFYLKGQEDSSILDAYVLHTLNHVLRTRDLISKNDAKVADAQGQGGILNGDGFLDHGFTRPKVLILLPLASIAFWVVKRLIQLTPSKHKVNIEHMDRFTEEFGSGGVESEEEDEDVENSKRKKSSKPSDFQSLFGGNNNDHFMIGIKYMGRKIKLYADFYSSDIIVASPLGLITKIGAAEVEKEKDIDYLSSIEVLIIDHADVILMQNWSHVNTVVEQLNRLPVKQHGTDIMRIRPWYLDGQAQFYRQTIILGSHLNPDINSLFNRHCLNYEGKVKLVCLYKGVLPKVLIPVRQIYERFEADSIADADDARFQYFCKKVFPKIKDSIQGGIMLCISSYFEFVRLRNFLKSQEASFCLLGEYTKQSDISRGRVWFFQGQRKIMLYTERAHFYHRYKIRAIQKLIIYSLPERKEFYPEIVNMLEGSQNMSCTVLFSRFDQFRLERIVGSASAKRMITSEKGFFVFC